MAIIAGTLANWVMLAVVFSIYFDLTKDKIANPMLYATVLPLGLMGVLVGATLSWAFFRFLNGYRRPIHAEGENLPLFFEEICQSANVNLTNHELYISDNKLPNAFAMGHKTLCITSLLLKTAIDDGLKNVLTHELGQHVHKDPIGSLISI